MESTVEIVGKFRRGIFPREIEHRRRFLLSYANAWLKIQSFSSHRYSLHRAHVNIICSHTGWIYRLSPAPPWIVRDNFGSFFCSIAGGIIHNSAVWISEILFPLFFSQTIFDRPDSPIFSKGGGKRNEKTMENNDSKIKSRQRKIALCVDTNVK